MSGFRVGVSRDFLEEDRNVWGDIGLGRLDDLGIAWEYMPRTTQAFTPDDLVDYDGVIFAGPAVTAASFDASRPRPAVLARFGVGYDAVDLEACTAHGVAVTITPDGARRPVATATLALMLAVQHNLVAKDRLVRERNWAARTAYMGLGLTGATIGLIGVGNTGRDLVRLLAPFETTVIGHDPYCPADVAAEAGVELVPLTELARRSDLVVVMAALTPETHHLINEAFLGGMKSSAALINVARGPIVDEVALIAALRSRRIRAAGLDVFESEPPATGIEELDNVTLAPHSLAWTAEMSLGNGGSCVQAIIDVAEGRAPKFVVNRDVLTSDAFRQRLAVPS